MIQASLWILIKDGQIFLWEKKRWFAKWVFNWPWGKQEKNETIEECMIREAKEEIWIDILKMTKVWINHFYFPEEPSWNQDVHIFMIEDFSWDVVESEEIKPYWFDINNIPYKKMWADDKIWLPSVLNWEKDIEYKFILDKNTGEVIEYKKIL